MFILYVEFHLKKDPILCVMWKVSLSENVIPRIAMKFSSVFANILSAKTRIWVIIILILD